MSSLVTKPWPIYMSQQENTKTLGLGLQSLAKDNALQKRP
jgi:hypothetical protein